MTPRLLRAALSALAFVGLAAAAHAELPSGLGLQFDLRTDRHSDFSALSDLESDDVSRLRGRHDRNIAYLDDEARLQLHRGPWSGALLARSSATLIGNRDAVDAYRHGKRLDRNGDRQWQLDARLRGFSGVGLEVGQTFAIASEFQGAVQVQGLALMRVRDRHIRGTVDFDAETASYGFDLRSDEFNDRLRTQCPRILQAPGGGCPYFQPNPSRGAALLFGGQLAWHRGDWTLEAAARDIGWLHWRELPAQNFTIANRRQVVDPDGFVVLPLALSGAHTQQTTTRRAQARLRLGAGWQATAAGRLHGSADYIEDFGWLPSLGWSQRWGPVQAEASWQFHQRRATLGLGWQGLRVRLGADRLGSGAHSRILSVGYSSAL